MRTAKFAFVAALCVLLGGAIDLTGPIGGGGPGFGITALVGSASGSPQYYVNAGTGSDSNAGTQASPWQTLHKVNNSVFSIIGTTINLEGSFSGGDNGLIITTTVAPVGGLIIQSYGTGVTISSGNSTACLTATNVPAVTITNIICTGGGNTTNTTAGISIVNSQAGNTKLAGPALSGVTVSGYGLNCIEIKGSSGSSGFAGGGITNSTVHDCVGATPAAGDFDVPSCVTYYSVPDLGSGQTTPAHTGFTLSDLTVYNCIKGSGVTVFESQNFTITKSLVHDIAASNPSTFGATAIWTADSDTCTISYNEVYNVFQPSGATEGDGLDLDAGITNCKLIYNKSHDVATDSILVNPFNSLGCCATWGNNVVAWNETQNGGLTEFLIAVSANATGPLYVFNNTFNCVRTGSCILQTSGHTLTATYVNNIFWTTPGALVIEVDTPVTGVTFTGNDYATTTGAPPHFKWNGTTYNSFALWQTATSQEKIGGVNVGLTSNPLLYVPNGLFGTSGYNPTQDMANNLKSGSPMVGAGLNVQTLYGVNPGTTDYYGVTVSAASLPVGAAAGDFVTFAASCTAATNYLARVSSFTKSDNVNYNSLLCGEVFDGDFAKLDIEYILGAPNHAAAILNLVNTSNTLTENGTCAFTARTGIKGDGSTCDEDTGFTSGNFTQNTATLGAYSVAGGASGKIDFGNSDSGSPFTFSNLSFNTDGTNAYFAVNEGGVGAGITSTATSGFTGCYLGQRTASNALATYLNEVAGSTTTEASATLSAASLMIFAQNNTTPPATEFSSTQISAAFAGSGSINVNPSTTFSNVCRRVNSFMTAYGINVY